MRSTAQIIDALGGRDAVAELTGARPRTVEQWGRIGIPHKHFGLLVEVAIARGIKGLSYRALYAAKNETLGRHGEAAE